MQFRVAGWLWAALALGLSFDSSVAFANDDPAAAAQAMVINQVVNDRDGLAELFVLPEQVEQVRVLRHTLRRAGGQLPGVPGNAITAWIPWEPRSLPAEWGRAEAGGPVVFDAGQARKLLPKALTADATDEASRLRLDASGTLSGEGLGLQGAQVARMVWFEGRGVWVELVGVPTGEEQSPDTP